MKIYTASSWKNPHYEYVVTTLKESGFEVYDFRSAISTEGHKLAFDWEQIDINWEFWNEEEFLEGLRHPLALNAFRSDFNGMMSSDVCVMILPCGKSSHIEAGFMKGLGKKLYILMLGTHRPELTYSLADRVFTSVHSLIAGLQAEVVA